VHCFFAVVLGECIVSVVGVDRIFGGLYRPHSPLVGRMISIAEDTPDITRARIKYGKNNKISKKCNEYWESDIHSP
jgi:hypothetical protein